MKQQPPCQAGPAAEDLLCLRGGRWEAIWRGRAGGLLGDPRGLYSPPAPGTSGPGKPPVDRNFLAPFINRQSVGLHCDP